MSKVWRLWALFVAVALLATACGTGNAVACEGGVATNAAPSATGAGDSLVSVESFRYTSTLKTTFRDDAGSTVLEVDTETVGAFVAPASHEAASQTRYQGNGDLFFNGTRTFAGEAIVIGEQVWVKSNTGLFDAAGEWVETTRVSVGDVPIDLSTLQADLVPPIIGQLIGTAAGFSASYSGQSVTKYELEAVQLEYLSDFVRSSLVDRIEPECVGIWVDHDAGTVVAYGFEGSGESEVPEPGEQSFAAEFSVLIEFSDVNSAAVTIDPPAEYISHEEFTG